MFFFTLMKSWIFRFSSVVPLAMDIVACNFFLSAIIPGCTSVKVWSGLLNSRCEHCLCFSLLVLEADTPFFIKTCTDHIPSYCTSGKDAADTPCSVQTALFNPPTASPDHPNTSHPRWHSCYKLDASHSYQTDHIHNTTLPVHKFWSTQVINNKPD